jgi:ABC-type lipoprotein release transport system permease subunit
MRDQALVVFDKRTIDAWFKDLEIKMKVYVLILSCMIMVLTFFMLIVAFTQKTRDSTWEHGVLRSMGMTKSQGNTIFGLEAMSIVVSSVLIGLLIGMVVVFLVTNLMAQLMELPHEIHFPIFNCSVLIFLIAVSTYYAVSGPVANVNKRPISAVVKGLV